jgi:DNA-directed RNA polymerase subunit RPC12/RpoP
MGKPKRERTLRRESARKAERLARNRERLFLLDLGGSPERPIDVDSAAVVETRARGVPCPRCESEHAVDEHAAVSAHGERLREVRLRCRKCGSRRSMWFRLAVLN